MVRSGVSPKRSPVRSSSGLGHLTGAFDLTPTNANTTTSTGAAAVASIGHSNSRSRLPSRNAAPGSPKRRSVNQAANTITATTNLSATGTATGPRSPSSKNGHPNSPLRSSGAFALSNTSATNMYSHGHVDSRRLGLRGDATTGGQGQVNIQGQGLNSSQNGQSLLQYKAGQIGVPSLKVSSKDSNATVTTKAGSKDSQTSSHLIQIPSTNLLQMGSSRQVSGSRPATTMSTHHHHSNHMGVPPLRSSTALSAGNQYLSHQQQLVSGHQQQQLLQAQHQVQQAQQQAQQAQQQAQQVHQQVQQVAQQQAQQQAAQQQQQAQQAQVAQQQQVQVSGTFQFPTCAQHLTPQQISANSAHAKAMSEAQAQPGSGDPETDFPCLGNGQKRYDILKFIGSGGEGSVYEAYDRVQGIVVALKVGNKTHDPNSKTQNKTFDKEIQLYFHCLRYRLGCIPRLIDCRIRSLVEAGGVVNNHAASSRERKEDQNALSQRNYLVQQLGNQSGIATGQADMRDPNNPTGPGKDIPDYLSLTLFGPSLRMMLQTVISNKQAAAGGASVSSTMELRSIYMIAEKMISILEQLHRSQVLHHDIKPQNICFRARDRRTDTDVITESDELSLIDLGMSYFAPETTPDGRHGPRPKRHCRFCGSMDYSSKGSRYRCQPSKRDDLESLGYLLLWLSMGNKSYKQWRSVVLEPYWEVMSCLYEDKSDIGKGRFLAIFHERR